MQRQGIVCRGADAFCWPCFVVVVRGVDLLSTGREESMIESQQAGRQKLESAETYAEER
jgi:hypothetical protein